MYDGFVKLQPDALHPNAQIDITFRKQDVQ